MGDDPRGDDIQAELERRREDRERQDEARRRGARAFETAFAEALVLQDEVVGHDVRLFLAQVEGTVETQVTRRLLAPARARSLGRRARDAQYEDVLDGHVVYEHDVQESEHTWRRRRVVVQRSGVVGLHVFNAGPREPTTGDADDLPEAHPPSAAVRGQIEFDVHTRGEWVWRRSSELPGALPFFRDPSRVGYVDEARVLRELEFDRRRLDAPTGPVEKLIAGTTTWFRGVLASYLELQATEGGGSRGDA